MSFDPKNSPARRRRLAEGRVHVAALVATASLIAGTTIGTPTVAEDRVDTAAIAVCPESVPETQPARTQQNECPAEETPPADTVSEDPPPTADLPPADPPPADPPPADPPAADPPAADTNEDTSSETPPPQPPADAPSGAAGNAAAAAPAEAQVPATSADAPAATPAPASTPGAEAPQSSQSEQHDAKPAAAKVQAKVVTGEPPASKKVTKHTANGGGEDPKPRSKSEPKPEPTPARSIEGPAENSPQHVLDGGGSYASLPASWTSLAPLSIPAFSVDGFPIPPFLLPIFQAAGAQYGVPWQVLASINEIETNFGRNAGVSSAGAMGWMQFIYSWWKRWGTDSDADGRRDPRNPVDAIFAAARYLRDAGASTNLPKAIFAYNHAGWYVDQVVERAREFAGLDKTLVAALSERALREDTKLYRAPGNPFAGPGAIEPRAGQALLLTKRQLTRMVLHSDDIQVYPGGRQDIAAGHVDGRVLATLVFLARSGLSPTVTSLTTGHSLLTSGGNVSAHSYGHAADIAAINGVPIMGHQGADSITAKTLDKLVQLQGYLQPNQIISLMTIDGHDNTMSMGDHDDHIHVGFPRVPKVPDEGRPADIRKLVASLRAKISKP